MKRFFLMLIICLAVLMSVPVFAADTVDFSVDMDVGPLISVANVETEDPAFMPSITVEAVLPYIMEPAYDCLMSDFIADYLIQNGTIKPESIPYIKSL